MNSFNRVISGERSSYKHKDPNEYGFYIACDDRAILNCVNSMLLNSGMVGISSADGKMHYLVDGRRGRDFAANQVKNQISNLVQISSVRTDQVDDAYIYFAIDSTLKKNGFDPTLMGTQILRFLIYQLFQDPGLLRGVGKRLYPMAMPVFHMSPSQVERNIRYAMKRRPKGAEETRVVSMINRMLDASMEEVFRSYGRPRD
ncbi:MAG: hypothetical protein J5752_02015 [Clostridiales bacterium]|nr:hypothetical protein [Clostridiales bacterium]